MNRVILLVVFVSHFYVLEGQKASIMIPNASFEGEVGEMKLPTGWQACGRYSTPDTQPGAWGVTRPPKDGQSYLGLVVRNDGTTEAAGVLLPKEVAPRHCYYITVSLATDSTYSFHNKPALLRLWGGTNKCDRSELLSVSPLIEKYNWQTYTLMFVPQKEFNFLTLEAYYADNTYPYNGCILIDDLSSIRPCDRAALPLMGELRL